MATDTNKVKLILEGDSKSLDRALAKSRKGVKRFGGVVDRIGGRIKKFGGISTRAFTGIGTRFGGLPLGRLATLGKIAAGAAVIGGGKRVLDFQAGLEDLAVQADIPAKEAQGPVRDEILQAAKESNQSKEAILGAMSTIVAKIGDFSFAREIAKDIGDVATATGAPAEDLAAITANLRQKFNLDRKGVISVLNQFAAQGKAGAFELKNLAEFGEELLTAASLLGVKDIQAVKNLGAVFQITKRAAGSPAEASKGFSNFIVELLSKGKREDIFKRTGFDIVDQAKSAAAGEFVFKDILEIAKGITAGAGADPFVLSQLFGRRAIRVIQGFAGVFKAQRAETGKGGFTEVDELFKRDFGDVIGPDFAKRAQFPSFKARRAKIIADIAAEKALEPVVTGAIDEIFKGRRGAIPQAFINQADLARQSAGAILQRPFAAPGFALDKLLKQVINISISDKQVSVRADSGKAPEVTLERGSFAGEVP